jgi:hypothetical protein
VSSFHEKARSKNNSHCALKLDMMKAYGRVEWNCQEAVMLKIGLHPSWVSKVMQCVTTTSFSVLLNGVRQEEFRRRVAAEGLSCLLKSKGTNENV